MYIHRPLGRPTGGLDFDRNNQPACSDVTFPWYSSWKQWPNSENVFRFQGIANEVGHTVFIHISPFFFGSFWYRYRCVLSWNSPSLKIKNKHKQMPLSSSSASSLRPTLHQLRCLDCVLHVVLNTHISTFVHTSVDRWMLRFCIHLALVGGSQVT